MEMKEKETCWKTVVLIGISCLIIGISIATIKEKFVGKQIIETKWIYSVSFLMKDTENNLQMNLITGFADTDYIVNQITDYSNKINKMGFKDSIVAINSNFIKYENNKENILFEINLNTNKYKTKKMEDFKNELIERFIEKTGLDN